jgi:hypothetical protein
MEWVFSDGTVVRLGGEVEGGSLFAQRVRAKIANPGTGVTMRRPQPCGMSPLDVNNWLSVQSLLDDMQQPKVLSSPLLTWPHVVPDDDPAGTIY